ncbi:MAG: leucine-rich repeat protein [Oscillospiraceae bacterium]|nr:leucine-rich repeat protein [Oscillospiraceae bacterium]
MKKLFCMLLATVLTLSLATTAFAAETTSGSCGPSSTWSFSGDTLTISGTGKVELDLTEQPWHAYIGQIENIIVEEGITALGRCVFLKHTSLKSVTLPESLTSIGSQTFQSCHSLTTITIPKNVAYIGDGYGHPATTFSGDLMENIIVDPENKRYYSIDGVLFDRYANALLCYPMGKRADSYTVPDGILELDYGSFWFFKGSTLHLPESLQIIDDSAFYAAEFPSITLPDSVTSIGQMAFTNCDQLTEITLPASVQSVDASGFASCEMLETITILNPDCKLAASPDTLSSNTTIRGYTNSTAHTYAISYGRNFIDIESNSMNAYDSGNEAYLALLPTDLGGTGPAFSLVTMVDGQGVITGYQPNIVVEPDKTNATYQEMLAFVKELTKNDPTNYAKARTVSQWVNDNMTYVFGMMGCGTTAQGVYNIWENRHGNCMGYTQLTNFMLYLLDIPTATITSYGHCWTAALINDTWIMIDSTNDAFDVPPNNMEDILHIAFAVNDNLVCVINDLTGVKLASYGISIYDHAAVSEITIPDYITHIYSSVFFLEDCYQTATTHLTIKGTAGSYAEGYLKENLTHYNDYRYEGGMFIATMGETKVWTEDDAIYLLRHVLFPDLYPIESDMDFTKDGATTEEDAIYLLRHVLFPDLYPL